jgi:hypothetical protein
MLCRFFFSALMFVLIAHISLAQEWISFHSTTPQSPEIKLLESDGSHVKYEVIIPGIWVKKVVQGVDTFQVLDIYEGIKDTAIGKPWLPSIGVQVGIPKGSSVSVSSNKGRILTFKEYIVAPTPTISFSYANGMAVENDTYSKDYSIYSSLNLFPSQSEVIADQGIEPYLLCRIVGSII